MVHIEVKKKNKNLLFLKLETQIEMIKKMNAYFFTSTLRRNISYIPLADDN